MWDSWWLLLGLFCLPCLLPFLIVGGSVIGLSSIAAFLVSNWLGVVPALVLGVAVGLGIWRALKRRQKMLPLKAVRLGVVSSRDGEDVQGLS